MRIEWKYPLTGLEPQEVIAWLRAQTLWTEAYPERQVHSRYYDYPDWSLLQATRLGLPQRLKIRERWYDQPEQAFWEEKSRDGQLVDKKRLAAPPSGLIPVIEIQYVRRYYVWDRQPEWRLTLDYELTCKRPDTTTFRPFSQPLLELKLPNSISHSQIQLPFRRQRHSKYDLAVQACYYQ